MIFLYKKRNFKMVFEKLNGDVDILENSQYFKFLKNKMMMKNT